MEQIKHAAKFWKETRTLFDDCVTLQMEMGRKITL